MKRINIKTTIIVLSVILAIVLTGTAFAKGEVGHVVSVQGKVKIERDGRSFEPKVKDSVVINDLVTTAASSSIKMQFMDGSTMTLGEKSRTLIKDHITNNNEMSLMNLTDGRMHLVTGSSNFRVQTQSATVATQRGTCVVIEACDRNQEKCVRVIDEPPGEKTQVCDTTSARCTSPTGGPEVGGAGPSTVGTGPSTGAPGLVAVDEDVPAFGDPSCIGCGVQGSSGMPSTVPPYTPPTVPPTQTIIVIDLIFH